MEMGFWEDHEATVRHQRVPTDPPGTTGGDKPVRGQLNHDVEPKFPEIGKRVNMHPKNCNCLFHPGSFRADG